MLQAAFIMQPWTQLNYHSVTLQEFYSFIRHPESHQVCNGQPHCQDSLTIKTVSLSAHVLRFGDTGFASNANQDGCLLRTYSQKRQ